MNQKSRSSNISNLSTSLICVLTSADIKFQRQERFIEYRNGIESAKKYFPNIEIEFLETRRYCCSSLETLGKVKYSRTHVPLLRNKGVLWVLALRWYLNELKKTNPRVSHLLVMTGRYSLQSEYFFEQIIKHASSDFVGKRLSLSGQVNTGLFYINLQLLEDWIKGYRYVKSELYSISVETSLMSFLLSKVDSGSVIQFVQKLDLFMPVFGKGIRDFKIE